jgi:hypothetical protein|tara:strand:- start:7434 stop:8120 length:687 start_codon:yes stop_codon:yes gene_type:complete
MKKLITTLLFATATSLSALSIMPDDGGGELPDLSQELTWMTLQSFDLTKNQSYTRPDGEDWGYDDDEYFYNVAKFSIETLGTYSVLNTSFNAEYVGVDRQFGGNETLLPNGTPVWMRDTMIYIYDDIFNPLTPTDPLYFADNDDHDEYEGELEDGDLLFFLELDDLEIDTEYYAVITTYDPKVAGDGWMMITGPGAVSIDIIPEPSAYPIAIGFLAFLYIAIKNRNKV